MERRENRNRLESKIRSEGPEKALEMEAEGRLRLLRLFGFCDGIRDQLSVQRSRDYIGNRLKKHNETGIVLCRFPLGGLTEENSGNEGR